MAVFTRKAVCGQGRLEQEEISYSNYTVIGRGGTGVVARVKLCNTGEFVAVKRLNDDFSRKDLSTKYKYNNQSNPSTWSSVILTVGQLANSEKCEQSSDQGVKVAIIFGSRELAIMRRLKHPNVVELKYFFDTVDSSAGKTFLNLVMEYVPENLYSVAKRYQQSSERRMPTIFVKLYIYQLFRSLAYIHSLGICHRSIKLPNILVNPATGVLKLCDFGRAKYLFEGHSPSPYTCSNCNTAPEVLFGSHTYTTRIDVWSAGCVLLELILGNPCFNWPGDSAVNRMFGIMKVLGTPSREQIHDMNPSYKMLSKCKFPHVDAIPWCVVLKKENVTPEVIDLISRIHVYSPMSRVSAAEACIQPFFDELRDPNTRLPNGGNLPPLFDFTEQELSVNPELNRVSLSRCHSLEAGNVLLYLFLQILIKLH